jgi:hypothetical protein
METRTITASDGVRREFRGKKFDSQYRIYAVYGDVSNIEALEESAQIIALETGCDNVRISL